MNPTTLVPLESGLVFAEGPRWHDGTLWLSDMYGGRVLTVARDRPTLVGLDPDGVVLEHIEP